DDRDLAAGAYSRIEPQYAELSRGRREQHVLQVLAKHLNRVRVGALLQIEPDLGGGRAAEKALPGVLGGEIELRRPVAGLLVNFALDDVERTLRIQLDQKIQNIFGLAAANREHAVRRDLLHRLAIVVVHLELLLLVDR